MENSVSKGGDNLFRTVAKNVPFFGVILGMLAGCSHAMSMILVKFIYHVNPFFQLLVRGLVIYSICLSVSIYQKQPIIPKTDWRNGLLLLTSAVLGSMIPVFVYISFQFISVADSVAIVYTYPAVVAFASVVFLKDKCSVITVVAVFLSVSGSILICKPFGNFENVTGILLALADSVIYSMYMLSIRKLSNFSWTTLTMQSGSCLTVFAAIAVSTVTDLKLPQCGTDGAVLVASSLFSMGGMVLAVLACKVESPKNVSVAQTIGIPFTIILQVLIIGTIPEWNSYLGAFFIFVSVLLIWWDTRKTKKPEVLNRELWSIFKIPKNYGMFR